MVPEPLPPYQCFRKVRVEGYVISLVVEFVGGSTAGMPAVLLGSCAGGMRPMLLCGRTSL